MKYDISELSADALRDNVVNYFAESDLPNKFFVASIVDNSHFERFGKNHWDGFAAVLVARGIPRISDVKADMLHWWEDLNWPGNPTIITFVRQNLIEFETEILSAVKEAYDKNDIIWFENLLLCSFGNSANVKDILQYLEEDCWKDFDKKYGIENVLSILKSEFMKLKS